MNYSIDRYFVPVESFIDFTSILSLVESIRRVDLISSEKRGKKKEKEKRKSILEEHFSRYTALGGICGTSSYSHHPCFYPFSTRNPTLASRTYSPPPGFRRVFIFVRGATPPPPPKEIKTTLGRWKVHS